MNGKGVEERYCHDESMEMKSGILALRQMDAKDCPVRSKVQAGVRLDRWLCEWCVGQEFRR